MAGDFAPSMPKIAWPQQPQQILEVGLRHGLGLPLEVTALLQRPTPPPMTAQVAQAFLRCFYAARDLARAERDLAPGGDKTAVFAAATIARRRGLLQERAAGLAQALGASSAPLGDR